MVLAVERVRDRLNRATVVLEVAGIPYAIVGGNAVAAWVSTVDVGAVRNTQDVDILLRREDLDSAASALEKAGFIRRHAVGVDMFLDGPEAKARDSVHIVFAGEKVRPEYSLPAPDVAQFERPGEGRFRVLSLDALVRMKLTSFRRKDQVHLQDMLEIGLIDENWVARLEPEHAARLQELIDTPDE
jgi:hypothetical protein